ncbi:hypothetical protein GOBAR_DD03422 [Gossypium barbadense]|nr:hypothetical protein GOBAR_DD03422 [Gossypium barbadense]
MELVDNEDVEIMVAFYCGTQSNKNAPIQLFAELAGVEATEDLTPLGEEDGVEVPCMVVSVSYVDSQSTIHGINIDLNAAAETDVVGDDVYYSSDPVDYKVDSESDPNADEVPDDIDDEGVNEDGNINASSVENQIRRIVIHNIPGAHMSRIDPDAARATEFSEYLEIPHANRMGVYSDLEELCVGQIFEMYELEPHIFRQRMARLESDMEGQTNTSFRQWLGTMEPWQWTQSFDEHFHYSQMTTNLVEGINAVLLKTRHLPISSVFSATFYRLATLMPRMGQQQVNQMEAGHVFVEGIRDAMVVNRRMARSMTVEVYSRHNKTFRVTETIGCRPGIPPRSYGVDLRNRRCDCMRFQTLHFPCAHVVAACAKVGLNVEQFIDEVYTIERTLRVWENEFPVLLDLSTWEVPPMTFELVLDKRLRRNLKGRPQSSRIHNEMDIREKSDGNLCGVCRLAGHNRSKCSLRNYHVGQSSQSGRN